MLYLASCQRQYKDFFLTLLSLGIWWRAGNINEYGVRFLYIYYTHPELMVLGYRFRLREGA